MPRTSPTVSKPEGDPEKAAAWRRVSRMAALSVALIGGIALYKDGGYPALHALFGAAVMAVLVHFLMSVIGSGRGLAGLAAANDPATRTKRALLFGLFCAGLGFAAVLIHDGGSLEAAAITGAILAVVGFLGVYFPVLTAIASFFSIVN